MYPRLKQFERAKTSGEAARNLGERQLRRRSFSRLRCFNVLEMLTAKLRRLSLQCRRSLDGRVHIFVLGRHLGFGNCGGLGRGNISRGSRGEGEWRVHTVIFIQLFLPHPPPPPRLCTNPLPVKSPKMAASKTPIYYLAFGSKFSLLDECHRDRIE